jgi:hypothetical protein
MVLVQLFIAISHALQLQRLQNHISKANKGNQPEHNLEAEEKLVLLDVQYMRT